LFSKQKLHRHSKTGALHLTNASNRLHKVQGETSSRQVWRSELVKQIFIFWP